MRARRPSLLGVLVGLLLTALGAYGAAAALIPGVPFPRTQAAKTTTGPTPGVPATAGQSTAPVPGARPGPGTPAVPGAPGVPTVGPYETAPPLPGQSPAVPTQAIGPAPGKSSTPPPGPGPTGAGPGAAPQSLVVEVTEVAYAQTWERSKTKPVFMYFTQPDCPVCEPMVQRFATLTRQADGRWVLGHVDEAKSPGLTSMFKVTEYPTTVLLWDGKIVPGSRRTGEMSDAELVAYVNNNLAQLKR